MNDLRIMTSTVGVHDREGSVFLTDGWVGTELSDYYGIVRNRLRQTYY